MWPGFLGTSSGFNDQGYYLMENAGCSPPGSPGSATPLPRDVIASLLSDGGIEAAAPPSRIESAVRSYGSSTGGSCVNGCILVNAQPYNASAGNVAGYIYEGDRLGGSMRLPGKVAPVLKDGIMATNHNWHYKAVPGHPEKCDGTEVSFSSLARYFAGQNKLESWARAGKLNMNSGQMKELLRTVAHGTTEHSLIFRPNEMIFEIAVASPNGVWDAPYLSWYEFSFESVFQSSTEPLIL
jgi:hypothetical protein